MTGISISMPAWMIAKLDAEAERKHKNRSDIVKERFSDYREHRIRIVA